LKKLNIEGEFNRRLCVVYRGVVMDERTVMTMMGERRCEIGSQVQLQYVKLNV